MRTQHGSRCFRVKKSPRHHFVVISISFLDVVAKHPSLFFPTSLVLTNLFQIQTFSVYYIHGKKLRGKTPASPLAGVGCLAEWLTHPSNTGYEPNPSNLFSYMDTVHTPIHLLDDSHHDFQCQDVAASRVLSTFGPPSLADHVSGRPGLEETGATSDRTSVATMVFSAQSIWKRDRDTNVAHALKASPARDPAHPGLRSQAPGRGGEERGGGKEGGRGGRGS